MSTKIRAKQAVYTNADRTKALPEGHGDAAYLLVGHGCEIHESELEKVPGAADLAAKPMKAEPAAAVPDAQIVGGEVVQPTPKSEKKAKPKAAK